MRIIPAIDIISGKCVRLSKGDYATQKTYNEYPLEIAKQFEDAGIQFLHIVDLDGAKSHRIINHKVLMEIALKTSLSIDFGGGIKSEDDIKIAFDCGAKQITVGSIAAKNSQLCEQWITKYGTQKIILGADCLDKKIAVSGWQEVSTINILDFIGHYHKKGIEYVICTDISKDGMLSGISKDLYAEILSEYKISLIASGGVSNSKDIQTAFELGCEGIIIGKAIYEGKISLSSLSEMVLSYKNGTSMTKV